MNPIKVLSIVGAALLSIFVYGVFATPYNPAKDPIYEESARYSCEHAPNRDGVRVVVPGRCSRIDLGNGADERYMGRRITAADRT